MMIRKVCMALAFVAVLLCAGCANGTGGQVVGGGGFSPASARGFRDCRVELADEY